MHRLDAAPRPLEQETAEWREIQKFTDECRRLWPGAKITLRPNDEFVHQARIPAGAPGGTTQQTTKGGRHG
jgi:hypothetical protein